MRALILAAFALGACASVPTPAPSAYACGPIELEPVEAPPADPGVTDDERRAIYAAVLGAVPLDVAKAWFRFHEVELRGYGRRMAERATATRERCLTPEP